ncbi:hypothetical protein L7F22_045907 [Adiantum nelumboides]|nr:hypothetical protein [Adiantum nelumboides]
MKASLKKLRNFTLHKSGVKEKQRPMDAEHQHGDDIGSMAPSMQNVEDSVCVKDILKFFRLAVCKFQVLTDMQEQYDGLLAAAQSISGSSYDFSRSIHEMASYMVETFGKTGDGDIGSSFSMLAKVQYEISKLLDLYAAHVSQTIIKPTENLLKELESVEEIRQRYETKRDFYNQMKLQKPKGRRKKGDFLDQQLNTIKEQLNEQATQLGLRFQSLKHGQELSLMTQAARHHKAQVHLFAKGLNSLNAVDSMIKKLSTDFHIDETLSEGETGLQLNEDNYEAETDFLRNNDDDVSSSSSPRSSQGSWQPKTAERREYRAAEMVKPWENTSKSAPLHPSSYMGTSHSPMTQDLGLEGPSEKMTTYVLPSPTGQVARPNNQAVNNASQTEQLCVGELPELPRIRTGNKSTSEEVRGLTGLTEVEAYNHTDVLGREEETNAWNESKGFYHGRRSPSHSYSTSFSEGLDPLSALSHGQPSFLASTPMVGYKRATRESDVSMPVTRSVDPLYKSGPVGHSAPWSLAPSRVSPCASPPMSHLSPPLISELHKLPAPPPPPLPPPLEPSIIAHSAPLGAKPGRQSTNVTPTFSSSAVNSVKKSRSIPSSINFAQNLHHTKLINADDSPVVESP